MKIGILPSSRIEQAGSPLGWWVIGRTISMLLPRSLWVVTAVVAVIVFGPGAVVRYAAEVDPPPEYSKSIHRSFIGSGTFALVKHAQPVFSIWVADPSDIILQTAADDLRRYVSERWGREPTIIRAFAAAKQNVLLLSTKASHLPGELRKVQIPPSLSAQGYIIQRIAIGGGRYALMCLGGSPVGARYASIEVLRRMTYTSQEAYFVGDRLEDEPYFTWRAVYINDSNHQFNNYSPNLICDALTYRWSLEEWKRYIDQMAFQRYNVLQIWIVPQMFSPDALSGGGIFDYFRDTVEAIAKYARPRGISVSLLNGINSSVKAGTLLNTLSFYQNEPIYRYLSPNKPAERELILRLWDYWSKALPDVKIWSLFPGDPGGCHEQGCGPETYVDLSIELGRITRRNNPSATIDFTVWQFFGWGTSWPTLMRKDSARIDRGFEYLLSKLGAFPPDTIYGINLNEFTSEPGIKGGGYGGGSAAKYISAVSRGHLVHTWSYSVTEGEGWINHHYRVPEIIKQRDVEARYAIAGGICYTMTPALNFLNQFACAEAFWNPKVSVQEIMEKYTEGAFGTSARSLAEVFPSFNVAPRVGYTFERSPNWKVDYARVLRDMKHNQAVLDSLTPPSHPRFPMLWSPARYIAELLYFCRLYEENCSFGMAVERARTLIREQPAFRERPLRSLTYNDAEAALRMMNPGARAELSELLKSVQTADIANMKARFRAKHYQIFTDCRNAFTALLPQLIDGFFDAFGADFIDETGKRGGF